MVVRIKWGNLQKAQALKIIMSLYTFSLAKIFTMTICRTLVNSNNNKKIVPEIVNYLTGYYKESTYSSD